MMRSHVTTDLVLNCFVIHPLMESFWKGILIGRMFGTLLGKMLLFYRVYVILALFQNTLHTSLGMLVNALF